MPDLGTEHAPPFAESAPTNISPDAPTVTAYSDCAGRLHAIGTLFSARARPCGVIQRMGRGRVSQEGRHGGLPLRVVAVLMVVLVALAGCQQQGGNPAGGAATSAPPAGGAAVVLNITPGTPPGPATSAPGLSLPRLGAPPTATVAPSPTPVPPTPTATPNATATAEARIVTLDYGLPRDPATLDPTLAEPGDIAAQDVAGMLFPRLARTDAASGQARPWLAREWQTDGLTTTIKLRDDVPWVRVNPTTKQVEAVLDEQGKARKVQASDVVFALRRALDPKQGADAAWLLYDIVGAQDFNTRPGLSPESVGVRALDPTTVEIRTTRPAAYLPSLLTLPMLAPLPEWAVRANADTWAKAENLVTAGPYVLTEWTPGKQITLTRNPLYPDRDKVAIERLRFPIVADAVQAYTLFSNGNLDSVIVPDSERATAQAATSQGRRLQTIPTGCTTFVGFTPDKLPIDRIGVRKALASAIDPQALVDKVVTAGLPASAFAPPGVFGAVTDGSADLKYDSAAARQFLAEAGFPDGKGFPPLTYAYNTCDSPTCKANQTAAEAVRDMWQTTLGIQVRLESLEWPAYLERINRRTPVDQMPHAWRMAWCQDFPDQHDWLYGAFNVAASGSLNRSRPGRFDQLTAQAAAEGDPTQRAALYRDAERILLSDNPLIAPLFSSADLVASQPWLTRQFPVSPAQSFDEWRLDWDAKRKALGK